MVLSSNYDFAIEVLSQFKIEFVRIFLQTKFKKNKTNNFDKYLYINKEFPNFILTKKMLRLSPHSFCDTFVDLHLKSPLLHAYEFMGISREGSSEFDVLSSFAAHHHWYFELEKLKTFLKQPSNAIVITCKSQKIEWVNRGFTRMTGYSANEALGRTPKFLQGKETSVSVRKMIRESLEQEKKFSGQVLNYRKTGELYVCDVEILPIYNRSKELVNFIALEKEVA